MSKFIVVMVCAAGLCGPPEPPAEFLPRMSAIF